MFFRKGKSGDGQVILICVGGIFALGFLIGYFIFQLIQTTFGEGTPKKQELFSKTLDSDSFERRMKIYLFSAATGLINLVIGYLVYSYFFAI